MLTSAVSQTLVLRPKSRTYPNLILSIPQHRNASVFDFLKRRKDTSQLSITPTDLLKGKAPSKPAIPTQGKLAEGSIFGEEGAASKDGEDNKEADPTKPPIPSKERRGMLEALDPQPWARARWQRKKVIQMIQHKGRISRTEQLLKLERQHQYKSKFWQTSVKKLMPLARQIAGKTVEDALVQLRFSKKRAATHIIRELEIARDEAVVSAGMGLGHIGGSLVVEDEETKELRDNEETSSSSLSLAVAEEENEVDGEEEDAKQSFEILEESTVPLLEKNGRKRMVKPTTIYIDQAWVNKGKARHSIEYRARGQQNLLNHRYTGISFLLKEEKTRLRRADEREKKKANARPWLHHPDRHIPHQRQYIMW